MDAAAPFVAKYGLECPINSFTKAVETDLSSKAAATLNKETTASMRNAIKIANGETFKTTWGGVFDYTIGIGSGTIKAQFDEKEKNDDEEDHYVQPIDSKISIYFSRTN